MHMHEVDTEDGWMDLHGDIRNPDKQITKSSSIELKLLPFRRSFKMMMGTKE